MRAEAASPAAPSADMMIMELTHAYQHLAAQSGLDRQWATRVESAITDHALWLDKHSRAGNTVAANLASLIEHVAKGTEANHQRTPRAQAAQTTTTRRQRRTWRYVLTSRLRTWQCARA